MPRLTSFTPAIPVEQNSENEWWITNSLNKGLLGTKGWIAIRRDVTIPLGFDGGPYGKIDRVNYSYLVRMNDQKVNVEFTISPLSGHLKSTHRVYPEVLTVGPVSTRIEVAMKGNGKAIYRPAWKDSDSARNITGFIDPIEFSDKATEESVVWLLGTLAILGLPQLPDAGG